MRPPASLRAFPAAAALLLAALAAGCSTSGGSSPEDLPVRVTNPYLKDRLGGLPAIQRAFTGANPGYAVTRVTALTRLPPEAFPRAVFVQRGAATVKLTGTREESSPVAAGDLVWLAPGAALEADAPIDAVAFTVPMKGPDTGAAPPPAFIRPDWDPKITDTPGGCATETGAYRRILLTWKPEVGPYLDHRINAHRVRITDSLTHYHPVEDGFDEFYLVQSAPPGARLIVSDRVAAIERPETLTAAEAADLLRSVPLAEGDLVYIPRGTAHRGLGGAIVQVVTVPGFRPGAEIGLDHHLRAINERLGLAGGSALPFHAPASAGPVRR